MDSASLAKLHADDFSEFESKYDSRSLSIQSLKYTDTSGGAYTRVPNTASEAPYLTHARKPWREGFLGFLYGTAVYLVCALYIYSIPADTNPRCGSVYTSQMHFGYIYVRDTILQ